MEPLPFREWAPALVVVVVSQPAPAPDSMGTYQALGWVQIVNRWAPLASEYK